MKKSVKKEIFGYLRIIVAGVVIAVLLNKFVIINADITSESMSTTFEKGDKLIGFRLSYIFSKPERGDVIIFEYPDDGDKLLIKRVIGLPGETIQIKGDTIYINGKAIKENYGKDPMTESGIAEKPLKLANDEFFVLGDNREISDDSRYEDVGPVKRKNIAGRAILRISPLSEFGTFK